MGPLAVRSTRKKVFSWEICQPKLSRVVLPYPSTLTPSCVEWLLKKVKNVALGGQRKFVLCYKDQCHRWGFPQAEAETKALVKAVHLGRDPREEGWRADGVKERRMKSKSNNVFLLNWPPLWGIPNIGPTAGPPAPSFSAGLSSIILTLSDSACLSAKVVPMAVPWHHGTREPRAGEGGRQCGLCAKWINTVSDLSLQQWLGWKMGLRTRNSTQVMSMSNWPLPPLK